jgi:hypothetical protein
MPRLKLQKRDIHMDSGINFLGTEREILFADDKKGRTVGGPIHMDGNTPGKHDN